MNVYISFLFFYQFQQSCRIIIATAPDQNGNTKPIIIITFASFFRLNLTELFAWRRKYNIISMVRSFVSHSIISKNRISKCAEKEENNKAYQKTMVYRKQYSLQRSMTLYDYIVWFTTIIIAQIIPTILANYQQSFSYRRSIQPSYTHRVNICKSIYWSDTCHQIWWMFFLLNYSFVSSAQYLSSLGWSHSMSVSAGFILHQRCIPSNKCHYKMYGKQLTNVRKMKIWRLSLIKLKLNK